MVQRGGGSWPTIYIGVSHVVVDEKEEDIQKLICAQIHIVISFNFHRGKRQGFVPALCVQAPLHTYPAISPSALQLLTPLSIN
jgi:hypothetical protein